MASKHKVIQCSPQKKFQSGTKIVGFSQRMWERRSPRKVVRSERLGGYGVFPSKELETLTAGLQGKVRYLKLVLEEPNTPYPKARSAYSSILTLNLELLWLGKSLYLLDLSLASQIEGVTWTANSQSTFAIAFPICIVNWGDSYCVPPSGIGFEGIVTSSDWSSAPKLYGFRERRRYSPWRVIRCRTEWSTNRVGYPWHTIPTIYCQKLFIWKFLHKSQVRGITVSHLNVSH
jgi:hypothetical protein